MPIIVVDTGELLEDHLGLINNVLDEFGEDLVTTLASPDQHIRNLMWYAKITVDDIYKMQGPWSQATGWFTPVEDQNEYDLPSTFRYLVEGLFYPNAKAVERSIEELYNYDPGRVSSGAPTRFAIWDEQIVLLEAPSETFAENKSVLGSDSNVYTCYKDHTATTDDQPITGVNYADYWVRDPDLGTAGVWAAGTAYVDGRITYLCRRHPVHMAGDGAYPDLPNYAIECLKAGMKEKYAKYRERDDWGDFLGTYKMLYKQLKGEKPTKNTKGFAFMRRGNRA